MMTPKWREGAVDQLLLVMLMTTWLLTGAVARQCTQAPAMNGVASSCQNNDNRYKGCMSLFVAYPCNKEMAESNTSIAGVTVKGCADAFIQGSMVVPRRSERERFLRQEMGGCSTLFNGHINVTVCSCNNADNCNDDTTALYEAYIKWYQTTEQGKPWSWVLLIVAMVLFILLLLPLPICAWCLCFRRHRKKTQLDN